MIPSIMRAAWLRVKEDFQTIRSTQERSDTGLAATECAEEGQDNDKQAAGQGWKGLNWCCLSLPKCTSGCEQTTVASEECSAALVHVETTRVCSVGLPLLSEPIAGLQELEVDICRFPNRPVDEGPVAGAGFQPALASLPPRTPLPMQTSISQALMSPSSASSAPTLLLDRSQPPWCFQTSSPSVSASSSAEPAVPAYFFDFVASGYQQLSWASPSLLPNSAFEDMSQGQGHSAIALSNACPIARIPQPIARIPQPTCIPFATPVFPQPYSSCTSFTPTRELAL